MLSIYDLSVEERDRLMFELTEEQRIFVNEIMVRGRKTYFARIMAARKGAHIPEDATYEEIEMLVDDWVYLHYVDAGVITDALKCDCGRSLRYAHTVKNLKTGETHTFGITHLELHTGIDAKIVAQIKEGFGAIDFELNEILHKLQMGWSLKRAVGDIPDGLVLPEDMDRHLKLALPLLDRQIIRLKRLIRQYLTVSSPARPRSIPQAAPPAAPIQPTKELFEDGQVVFDLFGELETAPAAQTLPVSAADVAGIGAVKRTGSSLMLEERLKEDVLQALQQGMQSARVICELLVTARGADDRRFSTGKPYLYPALCAYLDSQVEAGVVKLMERDQNDRIYRYTTDIA